MVLKALSAQESLIELNVPQQVQLKKRLSRYHKFITEDKDYQ